MPTETRVIPAPFMLGAEVVDEAAALEVEAAAPEVVDAAAEVVEAEPVVVDAPVVDEAGLVVPLVVEAAEVGEVVLALVVRVVGEAVVAADVVLVPVAPATTKRGRKLY